MGFTPAKVGLAGDVVTEAFGVPRDACWHRGVDFSSRVGGTPSPKDFFAGFAGTVIAPTGSGSFGTIALRPDSEPTTVVQFLHTSQIDVAVGDHVGASDVLGKTGQTSPTPVPIHLHIQVVKPGAPAHDCWDRNFVDPGAWAGV
jgi:murein DD-endopeptidase MepM/ murein hydrolase activator NlpD